MDRYHIFEIKWRKWLRWQVMAIDKNGLERFICRVETKSKAQLVIDELMSDWLDRRHAEENEP
jgi:hypothetical protein